VKALKNFWLLKVMFHILMIDLNKIPKESFTLVISVPPEESLKAQAAKLIASTSWPIRVI